MGTENDIDMNLASKPVSVSARTIFGNVNAVIAAKKEIEFIKYCDQQGFHVSIFGVDATAGVILSVVKIIKSSGEEDVFLEFCEKNDYRVLFPEEIVNAVKFFLKDNDMHNGLQVWNEFSRNTINSPGGRCPG